MRYLVYLLLVTFSAPRLGQLDEAGIRAINAFPYHGVALTVIGAYQVVPVPGLDEFAPVVALAKARCKKDLWPWIFLNRMIGRSPRSPAHPSAPKAGECFGRIKGMDLDGSAGALPDFLALWRLSLLLAKALGSPGVVVDLEAYNDYRVYNPFALAQMRGEEVDEVLQKLRHIGQKMADIAAEVYPDAKVWFLFTGLDASPIYESGGRRLRRSVSYIVEGLLDRAVERGLPLTVIDGGETTVGYYNPSPSALRGRISRRAEVAKPLLEKYRGRYVLAGTIAPYADASEITDWLRRAAGKSPPYKTLADFEPLFRILFSTYRYVWIYAAGAAKFYPFKPESARKFHPWIERFLREFGGRPLR